MKNESDFPSPDTLITALNVEVFVAKVCNKKKF